MDDACGAIEHCGGDLARDETEERMLHADVGGLFQNEGVAVREQGPTEGHKLQRAGE